MGIAGGLGTTSAAPHPRVPIIRYPGDASDASRDVPDGIFGELAGGYDRFPEERRKLMAARIETYFARL